MQMFPSGTLRIQWLIPSKTSCFLGTQSQQNLLGSETQLFIVSTNCKALHQRTPASLTIISSIDTSSSAYLQAIRWSSSGMALTVYALACCCACLAHWWSLILLSLALATASVPQRWDCSQTPRPSLARCIQLLGAIGCCPSASNKNSIEQTFASLLISSVNFRQSAGVPIPHRLHGLGWRLETSECNQN